jgi:hypothetical protein
MADVLPEGWTEASGADTGIDPDDGIRKTIIGYRKCHPGTQAADVPIYGRPVVPEASVRRGSEAITVDQAIDALNSMLEADPRAISALVAQRVPCTRALADHPTAQVGDDHGVLLIGLLGVLNGIFGKDEGGWGYISAEVAPVNQVQRFRRTPQAQPPVLWLPSSPPRTPVELTSEHWASLLKLLDDHGVTDIAMSGEDELLAEVFTAVQEAIR